MIDPVHINLFKSLAEGDEKAFGKLYMLYFPRLYSFALKIVQDSALAKDVVQNVFISLWESRNTFRYEHPESFLYKMVRNASLNYIRHVKVVDNLKIKAKAQFLGEELFHIDMVGNQPYVLIEKELQEKVAEVMDNLPEKCKAVFLLSRIDGLKNHEVAVQLGISIKMVEKHISKALSIFREKFADDLIMPLILLIIRSLE